jgi:NADPH-dependent curcumin reductase CurA
VTRFNRQIVLASRPDRGSTTSNFKLRDANIVMPRPVRCWFAITTFRSTRGCGLSWIMPRCCRSRSVVPGDAVGCVVASQHARFHPGNMVQGLLGWQLYAAVPPFLLRKIDPRVAPVSTALGVLGLSGLTAYFGLFEVGRIKTGETVVVSAAAGAVGSTAAQLAKLAGCHVIGIVGSQEKIRYLTEDLGLDAALNYKTGAAWRSQLAVHTPFGVDVYFDNVGGRISDAVLSVLNTRARVVVCGQIASYDREDSGRPRPTVAPGSDLKAGRAWPGLRARLAWTCEDAAQIEQWGLGYRLVEPRSLVDLPPPSSSVRCHSTLDMRERRRECSGGSWTAIV